MLCIQSSGKKSIGILAEPKTRIGEMLQWVGLAACKAPFFACSVFGSLLPTVGVYSIGLPTCKIPPAPVSYKISIGMRGALVWSTILYRVPRVGHYGDGVPRVSSLEECGLACSLGRPLSGRGLSSYLGLRVVMRPIRSRTGKIRWRVVLVGQCPFPVCRRFRRRRRTEDLRERLGRSRTRPRVQVSLCVLLVWGLSHEPYLIC